MTSSDIILVMSYLHFRHNIASYFGFAPPKKKENIGFPYNTNIESKIEVNDSMAHS